MISSKRLSLRALERSDLNFLHTLDNSFRNMRYFFEEPYETLQELEDLFEKNVHNHTERRFILEKRQDYKAVGVLTLYDIDEINRKAEIDIIIDEKFQGQGYGKEGFVLGVKYGFDILNLYKIYLLVLPGNAAAVKIYTHMGFQHECRLLQEFFVNGEYVDVHRMCMFAEEWRARRRFLKQDFGFE